MAELVLNEDQEALRDLVRDALNKNATEPAVRRAMESRDGIDWDLWGLLSDQLGVVDLAVPEKFGGSGGTFADTCVVLEELGASLACVPYFSHAVLAQSLLLGMAGDGSRSAWLHDLAAGKLCATVAFVEPARPWRSEGITMQAVKDGASWVLDGSKTFVVDGVSAQVIFVLARTDRGLSVFAIDGDAAGLTRTALPTIDLTRHQASIDLDGARATLVGVDGGGMAGFEYMMSAAALALAAESVGGANRVLEMAVEYAKTRAQFGRQIGSFQAIKHKCADMLLEVETARTSVHYARSCFDGADVSERDLAIALAKSYCADAYVKCAADNIQVHGGIGFTWEHTAHLYFKRAKANQLMFGDSIIHRERIAELIGA